MTTQALDATDPASEQVSHRALVAHTPANRLNRAITLPSRDDDELVRDDQADQAEAAGKQTAGKAKDAAGDVKDSATGTD